MILDIVLTAAAVAFSAAWFAERHARRFAEATNSRLQADCKRLYDRLAASERDAAAVAYLESTVTATEYDGLPIYTWSLSSPYATLAEAVRHVPARR